MRAGKACLFMDRGFCVVWCGHRVACQVMGSNWPGAKLAAFRTRCFAWQQLLRCVAACALCVQSRASFLLWRPCCSLLRSVSFSLSLPGKCLLTRRASWLQGKRQLVKVSAYDTCESL